MFGSSFSRAFKVAERPLAINSAAQLPNLEIWYNASSPDNTFNKVSTLNFSGTAISSWQNAGGLTSHDWNSTGGHRPVWYSNMKNGLGAVGFNVDGGTTECLTINPITWIDNISSATLVIAFKSTSDAAGARYITSTDQACFRFGQNGPQWVGSWNASASYVLQNNGPDNEWHHVVITYDGTKTGNANRLKVRFDGEDVALTFTGTIPATTPYNSSYLYGGATGTSSTNTSNHFIGYMAETLIWTRALSTSEINAVEQYLTNKWAI